MFSAYSSYLLSGAFSFVCWSMSWFPFVSLQTFEVMQDEKFTEISRRVSDKLNHISVCLLKLV